MFAVYLFLISMLALFGFYLGAVAGLDQFFDWLIVPGLSEYLVWPWFLGTAIVSFPLWWKHWSVMNDPRYVADMDRKGYVLFSSFLSVALLVMGLYIYGGDALGSLLSLAIRENPAQKWSNFAAASLSFLISLSLWLYFFPIVKTFYLQKRKK